MGISGEAVMVSSIASTQRMPSLTIRTGRGMGVVRSRIHAGRLANRDQTGSPAAEERRSL
jgi:hypothetical protein